MVAIFFNNQRKRTKQAPEEATPGVVQTSSNHKYLVARHVAVLQYKVRNTDGKYLYVAFLSFD
jgi:hypothetical protein